MKKKNCLCFLDFTPLTQIFIRSPPPLSPEKKLVKIGKILKITKQHVGQWTLPVTGLRLAIFVVDWMGTKAVVSEGRRTSLRMSGLMRSPRMSNVGAVVADAIVAGFDEGRGV